MSEGITENKCCKILFPQMMMISAENFCAFLRILRETKKEQHIEFQF